jgi:hypothetical protein
MTKPDGQNDEMSGALNALMDYEQADADGVMVLVSRQAIHEVVAEYKVLTSKLDDLRPLLAVATEVSLYGANVARLRKLDELISGLYKGKSNG